jgi:cell division protein FtsQ
MTKKQNRYRTEKASQRKVIKSWGKVILGGILVLTSVVLLSSAFAHSYHALLEASWLRINDVHITGLKHLPREEILNTMKVPRGSSVFSLKKPEMVAKLETLPWTKSAVVSFDMPGRLIVEVTEREPLALIFTGEFLLLDTEGKLFLQTNAEQSPNLLLISGYSSLGLKQGDKMPPRHMRMLRELFSALNKAKNWLPLHLISECQWDAETGFTLLTAQRAIPIQLGSEDMDQRLARLQQVFTLLGERHWMDSVVRIDLDYSNRAFVEGQFAAAGGGA